MREPPARELDLEAELPAPRRGRLLALLAGCVAALAVLGALYLTRGEPNLGLAETVAALGGGGTDTASFVVLELRLPRLVLAIIAGAGLGLAGVILQDALRNPVADPSLLGISQAAALVVAIAVLFPDSIPPVGRPALALIAGIATGSLLVALARSIRDPARLILVGVVLAMLYSTFTAVIVLLIPQDAASYVSQFYRFYAGSLSGASWATLASIWPWLVIGVVAALLSGRSLNLLQLGDDLASGLGMNVSRTRLLLLMVAVLLVAPIVAVAGPIAFVALLSPHVARFALRTSNAWTVLPASAAIGALVVLAADTLGRLLFFPLEIPAGVWTILLVGPVAILLARSSLRNSTSESALVAA